MILRLAIAFLSVGFAGAISAQQADAPAIAYKTNGILDASILENGKRLFLFRHGFSDKDEAPEYKRGGVAKRFIRLFKHPTEKNSRLAIAWLDSDKKNGMGIYSYRDGVTRFEFHISERIRQPSFFQSRNGDIFVGSRSGVVYWVKPDFTTLRYQLKWPAGHEPNPRRVFRKIEFTSFPGSDLVCAYSVADPRYHALALYNILIADPEKGWRTIDFGKRATGPATMTSEKEMKMLLFDRQLSIDLDSGKVSEQQFKVPTEGNAKVKPMSVSRLADGTLLSIWRKTYRSYMPDDIDPFDDGFYQRICEWDGQQWKVVHGKNRGISKLVQQVADENGGWWTATAEGTLLYRSPAGQFRELDYRSGVAMDSIRRLVSDGPQKLWLFGRVPIELGTNDLLKTEPAESTQWREIFSRQGIGLSRNAPFRKVSPILTLENKIICLSDLDKEYAFPAKEILPTTESTTVLLYEDNQNRPWAVSLGDQQQWYVAGFVEGAWKSFDLDDFIDKELNRIDGNNKDVDEQSEVRDIRQRYQMIGQWFSQQGLVRPIDYLGSNISFGPEGRVAVIYWIKVSLFDGEQWHSNIETPNPDHYRNRPSSVQFSDDGVRIWCSRYTAFDMPYHFWRDLGGKNLSHWQKIDSPAGMAADYQQRRIDTKQRIENAPELNDAGAWLYSDEFRFVRFTSSQVSLFDGQHWTTVPTSVSPFAATRGIAGMGQYHDGTWVFSLRSGKTYRYVVYHPPLANVVVAESKLGSLKNSNSTVQPTWTSDPPLENASLRFQVDRGMWSAWQPAEKPILPGAVMPAGEHELRIQLHCPDQMFSRRPLEYTFTTDYNVAADVQALIGKLSAMDFQERQDAEAELVRVGRQATELLSERYQTEKDPETRAALGRILKALNQQNLNQKTNDDETPKHEKRTRRAKKKKRK